MTSKEILSQARRYSRIDDGAAADAQVYKLINDGVKQFASEVGGFPKEEYLSLTPLFDTRTNMAMRITIAGAGDTLAATDVVITSVNRMNTNGDQVASDLQSAVNTATGGTGCTVTWVGDLGDADGYYFTFAVTSATSITFAAPSGEVYVNACSLLGLSGTTAAATVTGDFPEDCTLEANLPTDFLKIERVYWDSYELSPATRGHFLNPNSTGNPSVYHVRGNTIRVFPVPSVSKLFRIEYRGSGLAPVGAGYQDFGMTGVTYSGAATGIAANTEYDINVNVDGGGDTNVSFTTGAGTTYRDLLALLNAGTVGASYDIIDGDIRCTSESLASTSSIALSAGTNADILGATNLNTTPDTASPQQINNVEDLPHQFHIGIAYWVASELLFEQHDAAHDDMADKLYARYYQVRNGYAQQLNNQMTQMGSQRVGHLWYSVTNS